MGGIPEAISDAAVKIFDPILKGVEGVGDVATEVMTDPMLQQMAFNMAGVALGIPPMAMSGMSGAQNDPDNPLRGMARGATTQYAMQRATDYANELGTNSLPEGDYPSGLPRASPEDIANSTILDTPEYTGGYAHPGAHLAKSAYNVYRQGEMLDHALNQPDQRPSTGPLQEHQNSQTRGASSIDRNNVALVRSRNVVQPLGGLGQARNRRMI